MGSSASKAAQNSTRRYPNRAGSFASPSPMTSSRPPPASRRKPAVRQPSAKDDAIRLDSMDPSPPTSAAFADRLRQLGAVQPNPTLSHSSTASHHPSSSSSPLYPPPAQNTTLSVLDARRRLQDQADQEFAEMGNPRHPGREFLSVSTIREISILHSRGTTPAEIEARLGLKAGVAQRLGPPGLVAALGGAAGQG